jgi:hypothetical protein
LLTECSYGSKCFSPRAPSKGNEGFFGRNVSLFTGVGVEGRGLRSKV